MEGSNHVNWNGIIYKKGTVHMTEIESPFSAANGFNTNLVRLLTPYHVILSIMHIMLFYGHDPRNLVYEKL